MAGNDQVLPARMQCTSYASLLQTETWFVGGGGVAVLFEPPRSAERGGHFGIFCLKACKCIRPGCCIPPPWLCRWSHKGAPGMTGGEGFVRLCVALFRRRAWLTTAGLAVWQWLTSIPCEQRGRVQPEPIGFSTCRHLDGYSVCSAQRIGGSRKHLNCCVPLREGSDKSVENQAAAGCRSCRCTVGKPRLGTLLILRTPLPLPPGGNATQGL